MKYSIIIPAYNVADYIEQCVTSVFSQTHKTLEILLVDDGSTDGKTPALCDALASRDSRVRVIHQENGGLSAARNTGISHASGDYLLFLDGDDFWTDKGFLEQIDAEISKHDQLDALIYTYSYYFSEKEKTVYTFTERLPRNQVLTDPILLVETGAVFAPAWNKCIRREKFATSLQFQTGYLYEDAIWCAEVLKELDSYVVLDNPQCMYRQNRQGSITSQVSLKHLQHSFLGTELNLRNVDDLPDTKKKAMYMYACNSYISILPFVYPYLGNQEIHEFLHQYKFLLQYSNHLPWLSFRLTAVVTKWLGVNVAAFLQYKLLGLYRTIKRMRATDS